MGAEHYVDHLFVDGQIEIEDGVLEADHPTLLFDADGCGLLRLGCIRHVVHRWKKRIILFDVCLVRSASRNCGSRFISPFLSKDLNTRLVCLSPSPHMKATNFVSTLHSVSL
jgi:hypothetical protein